MKTNFYIEYAGTQFEESTLIKEAKKIWTDSKRKASELKSLELYVKPEENTAFYVFNEVETGGFPIS